MLASAKLVALPAHQTAKLDADVHIQLSLSNVGQAPLWLNTRMLLNNGAAQALFRELWLEVTDPAGQPLPFVAKIRAGEAQPTHYQRMEPGEKREVDVLLSRYFPLRTPGRYRIVAHYQDGCRQAPAAPPGTQAFTARLQAEPIDLQLE